jgi:hypothetical protein
MIMIIAIGYPNRLIIPIFRNWGRIYGAVQTP